MLKYNNSKNTTIIKKNTSNFHRISAKEKDFVKRGTVCPIHSKQRREGDLQISTHLNWTHASKATQLLKTLTFLRHTDQDKIDFDVHLCLSNVLLERVAAQFTSEGGQNEQEDKMNENGDNIMLVTPKCDTGVKPLSTEALWWFYLRYISDGLTMQTYTTLESVLSFGSFFMLDSAN